MTTTTGAGRRNGSAYPITDDALTDRVRKLAGELGDWPSQRRVMRTCRVGAPRADAVLARLRATGYTPTPASAPAAEDRLAIQDATEVPTVTVVDPEPAPEPASAPEEADEQVTSVAATPADAPAVIAEPEPLAASGDDATTLTAAPTAPAPKPVREPVAGRVRVPRWPLWLIAAGAFVAIWGGWVGLGELVGFGPIRLLPGIADDWVINSAITLPLGMEAYAAYALRAWLAPPEAGLSRTARRFACWSALGALALGAAGQIAYHLMAAAQMTTAPWQITAFVSCLPVIVLGCGAALAHLTHQPRTDEREESR
jgi:hypothetical protein